MRKEGPDYLKNISMYHRSSLAEAIISRFKQLMAEKIALRKYNAQVEGVMVYVSVTKKLNLVCL